MIALILIFAWNSNGVTFTDLNGQDVNYAPSFEYFITVAFFGIIYAIVTIVLFWPLKQYMPPVVVSLISAFVLHSNASLLVIVKLLYCYTSSSFLELPNWLENCIVRQCLLICIKGSCPLIWLEKKSIVFPIFRECYVYTEVDIQVSEVCFTLFPK